MTEIELQSLVAEIFNPLVGDLNNPQTGKCVGFLIGVTIKKVRYYFVKGDISLYQGTTLPACEDIVFFIGSNSKVFTATLLPLAASKAKNGVTPETPVSDLLPSCADFKQPNGEVLLWHLATHSAGFPNPVCGARPHFGDWPFTSLNQFMNTFSPPYAPGEYWVYSNPAFALLGDLLAHAYVIDEGSKNWDNTYKQWPQVIVEQVVQPLGMTSTQVEYSGVVDVVAQGYNYTDKGSTPKYEPTSPPKWSLGSAGLGAGALSSTLNDMLTFLEAQIDPSSVSATDLADAISTTQEAWPSSDSLSMGLGWQRSNNYLDKNGGLPGYNTYMAFDPSTQIGVFVFGNTDEGKASAAVDGGGRTLFEKIRGEKAQPSKFPRPPAPPECP